MYLVEGIEFASMEDNVIYIEICGDAGYEYRYISLEGNNILWHEEEMEQIVFFTSGNEKKTIQLHGLRDVAITNERVYALTFETDKGEILEYSKQGVVIKKYSHPLNYAFYRFPKMNDELSVICQGNDITADKFGRNEWRFKYNNGSGCWEKESLSY